MSIWEYYLQYLQKICEGSYTPPAPITVEGADEMSRMMSLQKQVMEMGIPAFVRLCTEADGIEIAQSEYDAFDPDEMMRVVSAAMAQSAQQQEGEPVEAAPEESEPEREPEPERHAFEVFLDCICLDENLIAYLIDVLKREDWATFYKLSQITTRMDLDPREFLIWFGNKELYADSEDERACAVLMDACFERLREEGETELLAALLSGDQKTFEIFRTQAPELVHVPAATYEWYEQNYLERLYPVRCFMRAQGVKFPKIS
ncbi:MAG: hypothetical protein IJF15_07170 [Oscillospiraceae bacterium]|nr:hypothetical protein [Oscillospiraceae bacterium]